MYNRRNFFENYIVLMINIKLHEICLPSLKGYVGYSGAHSLNVLSYDEEAINLESGDTSTLIILLS